MPATKKKPVQLQRTDFLMFLKRAGKTAAHFATGEEGTVGPFKDSYMPIDTFKDLGEPDVITVTITPGDDLNG